MRGLGLGLGMSTGGGPRYRYQWQAPNAGGLITLPAGITFACASTRTAQINLNQLITGIGANQAVVAYNSFLGKYGLQVEASRANYVWYSQTATQWGATGTPTYNQTDPAGTTTGAIMPGNANSYAGNPAGSLASVNFAISAWILTAGHSAFVVNTTPATQCVQIPSGNGSVWRRYSSANTVTSINNSSPVIGEARVAAGMADTTATSGTYAFLQTEAGLFTTSYVPTNSAPVTRAASTVTTTIGAWSAFKCRVDFYPYAITKYATEGTADYSFAIFSGTDPLKFRLAFSKSGGAFTANRVVLYNGTAYTGANNITWSEGDLLSFRLDWRGNSCVIDVYKNGAFYVRETIAATQPTTQALTVYNCSINDGTLNASAPIAYLGAT